MKGITGRALNPKRESERTQSYLAWSCDEHNTDIVSNNFLYILPFFLMGNDKYWPQSPVSEYRSMSMPKKKKKLHLAWAEKKQSSDRSLHSKWQFLYLYYPRKEIEVKDLQWRPNTQAHFSSRASTLFFSFLAFSFFYNKHQYLIASDILAQTSIGSKLSVSPLDCIEAFESDSIP